MSAKFFVMCSLCREFKGSDWRLETGDSDWRLKNQYSFSDSFQLMISSRPHQTLYWVSSLSLQSDLYYAVGSEADETSEAGAADSSPPVCGAAVSVFAPPAAAAAAAFSSRFFFLRSLASAAAFARASASAAFSAFI